MYRFVAYLGQATRLERVISEPEHSLVIQSFQPAEMTSGVVNALDSKLDIHIYDLYCREAA